MSQNAISLINVYCLNSEENLSFAKNKNKKKKKRKRRNLNKEQLNNIFVTFKSINII